MNYKLITLIILIGILVIIGIMYWNIRDMKDNLDQNITYVNHQIRSDNDHMIGRIENNMKKVLDDVNRANSEHAKKINKMAVLNQTVFQRPNNYSETDGYSETQKNNGHADFKGLFESEAEYMSSDDVRYKNNYPMEKVNTQQDEQEEIEVVQLMMNCDPETGICQRKLVDDKNQNELDDIPIYNEAVIFRKQPDMLSSESQENIQFVIAEDASVSEKKFIDDSVSLGYLDGNNDSLDDDVEIKIDTKTMDKIEFQGGKYFMTMDDQIRLIKEKESSNNIISVVQLQNQPDDHHESSFLQTESLEIDDNKIVELEIDQSLEELKLAMGVTQQNDNQIEEQQENAEANEDENDDIDVDCLSRAIETYTYYELKEIAKGYGLPVQYKSDNKVRQYKKDELYNNINAYLKESSQN